MKQVTNIIPPFVWFCIKFDNQEKLKWFRSKGKRRTHVFINYWRKNNNFKYCKIYDPKTRQKIFWFNKNTSGNGNDDRQTIILSQFAMK